MKAIYSSILLLAVASLVACRDESLIRMPEVQEAANMRIVLDPTKNTFDSGNISNSTMEFDAYSVNNNLSKVEFIGTYTDYKFDNANRPIDTVVIEEKLVLTLQPSAFVNGKARGVITANQVATAFGLTGGVNGIGARDEILLAPYVTLNDGRVFSYENSSPDLVSSANPSFTSFVEAVVR
ncbi:MAG: hypothetical protein MUD08_16385 [Cytophagales bacterium]|jgi:hypothetical protein|nr:hypothetical protein [Cytophagales bacterium]